jgi:2-polyprenyl-6-hydroxyphenyl methylase/3-demethylubiquinone-9 3-methyltransferase
MKMANDAQLARLLTVSTPPSRCKACGRQALLPAGAVDFNRVAMSPPPFPEAGIAVDLWQCADCGFAWAPAFDTWSDADFARHIYNAGIALTELPEFSAQRSINTAAMLRAWFAGYPPQTRFLDYGCGPGMLVEALRQSGFQACGYDRFHPEFSAPPAGRFDIITCFEVFEHLSDIASVVDELAGLLAEDGILVIGTYLAARPLDLDWWYLSPRSGHICFWTFPALSAVFNPRRLNVAGDGKLFSFVFPDAAKQRVMRIFGRT